MLTPFEEIVEDAYSRHYAVGAFNCLSLENVLGAVDAAEQLHSPLILQLAEVQFPYAPMELMAPVFLKAAKAAKVPVAVHLDHGQSVETCIKAIKAGFNSVMYDGASLPFEKNVYESGLVARLAHACGVDVEAELGKVGDTGFGSGETGVSADVFTDVAEAVRFVEETEVDALAVAIGNKHGRYTSTPHLNINRLREINSAVPVPLVLHGGSGTGDDDFKACIRSGISKINVATAIQMAVTSEIESYIALSGMHDYITMKKHILTASGNAVAAHMELFESAGKA